MKIVLTNFSYFIRMIMKNNSYVYFKIYFKRKFESKHISHVSVFKKSNIFLIAAPHLYSVSVVL